VDRTTDELGHVVSETHDVATGALVRREGPNQRTWSWCFMLACSIITDRAPEEWSIDGLGRVTEHRVAIDPAPGVHGYALAATETFAYVDATVPNTRTSARLRELGGTSGSPRSRATTAPAG